MADLEATMRPYVDSGAVPGLVALVARGDDVGVEALGVQGTSGAPMRHGHPDGPCVHGWRRYVGTHD